MIVFVVLMMISVFLLAWGAVARGVVAAEMEKGFVDGDAAAAVDADAVMSRDTLGQIVITTTKTPRVEARVSVSLAGPDHWRFTARRHPLAQRLRFQVVRRGMLRSANAPVGDVDLENRATITSTDDDVMRGVLASREVRDLVLQLLHQGVERIALMNDASLVVHGRMRPATAAEVRRRLLLTQALAAALDRQFDAPPLLSPTLSLVVPTDSGSPIGVRGL